MERTTDANDEMSLEEVREAARHVLDYLNGDERKHFEGCDVADRRGHILESLERLRRWLEAEARQDEAEALRRSRLEALNGNPCSREELEAACGPVWSTSELQRDFVVLGFMAPYVVVCRKSDGQEGSLEFQHQPRFYFSFQPA